MSVFLFFAGGFQLPSKEKHAVLFFFLNISFRFRDIQVFKICRLATSFPGRKSPGNDVTRLAK